MKISRKTVVDIYNALNTIKDINVTKPKSYIYKASKLRNQFKIEIDALEEARSKDRDDFEKKKADILIKYSEKDESGNPKTKGNTNLVKDLIFPDGIDTNLINTEINELIKSIDWERVANDDVEYDKLLNEEIEIEVIKFNFDDLFDGLDEKYMDILQPIID